jgi:uncharacterized membrane protein
VGAFPILIYLFFIIAIPVCIYLFARKLDEAAIDNGEVSDTFKFRTIVYLVLGVFICWTIIGLFFFLALAYFSYKAGKPIKPVLIQASAPSSAKELAELHQLLSVGAITKEEYESQKQKLLR